MHYSLFFEALLSSTMCFLNSHLDTKISNSISQARTSQFQTEMLQTLMMAVKVPRYFSYTNTGLSQDHPEYQSCHLFLRITSLFAGQSIPG